MIKRFLLRILVGLIALQSPACGETTPGAPGQPGFTIVSGTEADTARANMALPLVVLLNGPDGYPAENVTVRVRPLGAPPPEFDPNPVEWPGMVLQEPPQLNPTTNTDARGRVSIYMQRGRTAGISKVVLEAPQLGYVDTARFVILPARPYQSLLHPAHDTTIFIATAIPQKAAVVDQFGNARPEPPQLTVSEGVALTGDTLRVSRYGLLSLTAGTQTRRLTVVPRGTIAAAYGFGGREIVVMDLDGSNRRTLFAGGYPNGLVWTPDGQHIVAALTDSHRIPPNFLYTIALDGSRRRTVTGGVLEEELYPAYSRDGKWFFFVGPDPEHDGWRDVFRVALPSGAPQRVGRLRLQPEFSVIGASPDGSTLVYGTNSNDLQLLNVESNAVTRLLISAGSARFRPAGDMVAFKECGIPGVVNSDGTGLRYFPGGGVSAWSCFADMTVDWSPDGEWIIVVHGRRRDLELIQVSTGLQIALPGTDSLWQPAWRRPE